MARKIGCGTGELAQIRHVHIRRGISNHIGQNNAASRFQVTADVTKQCRFISNVEGYLKAQDQIVATRKRMTRAIAMKDRYLVLDTSDLGSATAFFDLMGGNRVSIGTQMGMQPTQGNQV